MEVYFQLGDSNVSEVIEKYPMEQVTSLIRRELDILFENGNISRKNRKYLLNPKPILFAFKDPQEVEKCTWQAGYF